MLVFGTFIRRTIFLRLLLLPFRQVVVLSGKVPTGRRCITTLREVGVGEEREAEVLSRTEAADRRPLFFIVTLTIPQPVEVAMQEA